MVLTGPIQLFVLFKNVIIRDLHANDRNCDKDSYIEHFKQNNTTMNLFCSFIF